MRKLLFMLLLVVISILEADIYVINSISQTLSQLDLETQLANNDFAELGQFAGTAPNKMAFYEHFVYVVITYENCIQKIDLERNLSRTYIYLEDSSFPNDIIIKDNFAYVTGSMLNKLYKIDLTNDDLIGSINVGLAPQGMGVYENTMFVANTGYDLGAGTYEQGTLSVVDLIDFSVIDTIEVDLNPTCMELVNNELHVVCTGNYVNYLGKINIIDPETIEIQDVLEIGGSPASISYGSDEKVYLGNAWPAGVYVYNPVTLEIETIAGDGTFLGGNTLTTFDQYLAVVDAQDYIQNSIVRFYSLTDYQLIWEIEVGVGATDVKFHDPSSPAADNEIIIEYPRLLGNYPNPFNPSTTISFNISRKDAKDAETCPLGRIVIYNVKGQKVKTFDVTLSGVEGCQGTVNWHGTDENNQPVSSGVYLYQLKVGNKFSQTRKMLLLK